MDGEFGRLLGRQPHAVCRQVVCCRERVMLAATRRRGRDESARVAFQSRVPALPEVRLCTRSLSLPRILLLFTLSSRDYE